MKNVIKFEKLFKMLVLLSIIIISNGCGGNGGAKKAKVTPLKKIPNLTKDNSTVNDEDVVAPIELTAELVKGSQVDLAWKMPQDSQSQNSDTEAATPNAYRMERSVDNEASWKQLEEISSKNKRYTDLLGSEKYAYRVRAVYGDTVSEPSESASPSGASKQGEPKKIAIKGPLSLPVNTCTEYLVEVRSELDVPAKLSAAMTVTLNSGSIGKFYTDPKCEIELVSYLIASGASQRQFYFKHLAGAKLSLSASASLLTSVPLSIEVLGLGLVAISNLTPSSGRSDAPTTVVVTGANFDSGAKVNFGTLQMIPTSQSESELSFIAPPGTEPEVSVTVTNANGTVSNAAVFKRDFPKAPPVLLTVSPSEGSGLVPTTVALKGSGFLAGAVVKIGELEVAASVLNATELSFVMPPRSAGSVAIRIKNPDLQLSEPKEFRVVTVDPNLAIISGLSPSEGLIYGNYYVSVSGSNFDSSCKVYMDGAPVYTAYFSSTRLDAWLTAHAAGSVSITVVDGAGNVSIPKVFSYQNPIVATLDRLSQYSGSELGNFNISAFGTNFNANSKVKMNDQELVTARISSTELLALIPVHAPGAVSLTVVTDGVTSRSLQFTYDPYKAPAPIIDSLEFYSGSMNGGYYVKVNGRNFYQNSKVLMDGADGGGSTSYGGANLLYWFTPRRSTAGFVNLTVQNPDGVLSGLVQYEFKAPAGPTRLVVKGSDSIFTTVCGEYTLEAHNDAGVLTPPNANLVVRISSQGQGSVYTDTSCSQAAASQMTLAAGTASGKFYYKSLIAGTTSLAANADGFPQSIKGVGIVASGPVLSSVSPYMGSALGNYSVTLIGKNFTQNSRVLWNGVAISSSIISSTELRITVGAYAGSAAVDITVSENGQTSLMQRFTYNGPFGPTALSLTGPSAISRTECAKFTVVSRDSAGAAMSTLTDLSVGLRLTGSAGIYNSNSCQTTISQLTLSRGTSSGDFYVKNMDATSLTLYATAANVSQGTMNVTITIPPATAAVLTMNTGSTVSFPDSIIGGVTSAIIYVVNSGETAAAITGADFPEGFSYLGTGAFPGVEASCLNPIKANSKCSVTVKFSPRKLGLLSGQFKLKYTPKAGMAEAISSVGIAGNSVAPSLSVTSVDLGSVTLGSGVTPMKEITITNGTSFRLNKFSIAPLAAPFEIYSKTCLSYLDANKSCTVTVRFTATDSGRFKTSLLVPYNDDLGNMYQASGEVKASAAAPVPLIDITSILDFSSVTAGSHANKDLTVTNTGTVPANLVVTSPPSGDFLYTGVKHTFPGTTGTCSLTTPLGVGKSCTIRISFYPKKKGVSYAMTIDITGEGNNYPDRATLKGVGK